MNYETIVKYPIKYFEMLSNKALKETSLLLFLQDIAGQNADKFGFGADFMFSNHFGWFLLKYKIKMKKWPKNEEEVIIKTIPRGFKRIYAFRDFYIYNSQNEEIGRIASCWTLIDLETKKPINLQNVPEYPIPYEEREDDMKFDKISELESYQKQMNFFVLYDDIDVNCHANNANFLRWALAPLDEDFRKSHFITGANMLFKHEIKCREELISCVNLSDNISSHILKNAKTGEILSQMEIVWSSY